jgi:galactokinase
MKLHEIRSEIISGSYDAAFKKLYGEDCDISFVRNRYAGAVDGFFSQYSSLVKEDSEVCLFSVPGRSEISGNHTDHNHGKVIAASISLDIIAVAVKNDAGEIRVKSEGFPEDIVSLDGVDKVNEGEFYKACAIIRGVCDGFLKNGFADGGFYAYTTSSVLKGSGLSSSAAFEDMIGNILNHFYNEGKISYVEIAKISQYAENVHFGKPCGLMDQMACAAGGFVAIDFADPKNPIVEKPDFDLSSHGYSLCIVNTGGNHADLNEDYASIPAEMKSVAAYFGKSVLREIKKSDVMANISALREKCGDRAVMRALHFLNENERVERATAALKKDDINDFLSYIKASGLSSATLLQNTYTTKNVREQGISLALAVAADVLDTKPGAVYRVHGGGFAGTIQAFVPNEYVTEFNNAMTSVFGADSAYVLKVRLYGAVQLEKLL